MIKDTFLIPNNAPERLRGKKLTVIFDQEKKQVKFQFPLPDEATAQEMGYMKWITGEIAEHAGLDLESRKIGRE